MRAIDVDAFKADYHMADECKDCETPVRACEYDRVYTKMDFCSWLDDAPTIEPEPQWIPCQERLPEEQDSIFAKYYGTDRWRNGMMRKRSDRVIVTVEYPDGKRATDVASTSDGRWVNSISVVKRKVIAWMPLPEPYRGGDEG